MKLNERQVRAILPLVQRANQLEAQKQEIQAQVAAIVESWNPPPNWALDSKTWEVREQVAAKLHIPDTDGERAIPLGAAPLDQQEGAAG